MRARHALVCVALAGALTACSSSGQPAASAPATSGAQQAVDAIAEKWPAPNPRDTSDGCRAKDGDTAKGCESRVTTDAVTVLEFADEATAARWAKELGKAGDTRQAGRYVLSWTAREQDLTSDEARADMVTIVKAI
ncbi:hypothetical protein ACIA7R_31320 [Micromonospora chalcea]